LVLVVLFDHLICLHHIQEEGEQQLQCPVDYLWPILRPEEQQEERKMVVVVVVVKVKMQKGPLLLLLYMEGLSHSSPRYPICLPHSDKVLMID
jgi:hypothetical protein